jgi:hypothetical protein
VTVTGSWWRWQWVDGCVGSSQLASHHQSTQVAYRDRVSPLPQVIIGSERSRIRATLPFYFTRRFLDAPLTQRQRTASKQWRHGAGAAGGDGRGAAGGDVEAGLGTQHGSTASIASTDGGDVPLQGSRLQQGDCQGLHITSIAWSDTHGPCQPLACTLPSSHWMCSLHTAGRQLCPSSGASRGTA